MKTRTILLGLSATALCFFASPASAQETPTMNQPNNGFFEGPNPEWATLHATDARGTTVHRQYHRDAAKALLDWNEEHRLEKGTRSYDRANRLFRQTRNMLHRQFHTDPANL